MIGIGLLGMGWMGEVHSTAYARIPSPLPRLRGPRAARRRCRPGPGGRQRRDASATSGATDWCEALADPAVEAVSITAPNHMHREMALAAATAGKHFWGEKPLGRFPSETAEIAAAVEAAGIRTCVGLNYRHAPAVQHAKGLLEAGALGRVDHFRIQFLAGYSANPQAALSWRFSRELAGLGVLGDLGSLDVDLAQYLLGQITRVSATSSILIPLRPPGRRRQEAPTSASSTTAASSDRWRTRIGRPRSSSSSRACAARSSSAGRWSARKRGTSSR